MARRKRVPSRGKSNNSRKTRRAKSDTKAQEAKKPSITFKLIYKKQKGSKKKQTKLAVSLTNGKANNQDLTVSFTPRNAGKFQRTRKRVQLSSKLSSIGTIQWQKLPKSHMVIMKVCLKTQRVCKTKSLMVSDK